MVPCIVLKVTICSYLILLLPEFGLGASFQRKYTVVSKTPTAKIVDGWDVPKRHSYHPHPYLVSIQFKNINNEYQHTCGGAILDRHTVISASHCFDDYNQPDCWARDPSCYRIVAGMYNLSDSDSERQQISEFSSDAIEEHENFDGFHYDNDIALIHLDKALDYSTFVRPIRLVNPKKEFNKVNATIAGWGTSYKNGQALPITEYLQEARVNIYSDEQCMRQWGDDYHPENMICAAGGGDLNPVTGSVADACQGDSGGPLIAKDVIRKRRYLVGLISWGFECGIREYPGLYTRVETYLPWIKEKRRNMRLRRQRRSSWGAD